MLLARAEFALPQSRLILEGSVGLVFPYDELKGDDYVTYDRDGYVFVDSALFADHLGAQPGIYIAGTIKYGIDKHSITRLVGTLTYNGFNSFQPRRSGTTLVRFVNNTYQQRSIEYDYGVNNVGLGLGLEIAPTSFTNLISPFFGANFNFNFFSADITRRSGFNDSVGANLNSFRMGVSFTGGLEFNINKTVAVSAGIRYDLGNLLLKETKRDGYIEWGSRDANLNDENGRYISNLYYAIGEGYNFFQSKQKKMNWGTAFLSLSFRPFDDKPAKKKAPPKGTKLLHEFL